MILLRIKLHVKGEEQRRTRKAEVLQRSRGQMKLKRHKSLRQTPFVKRKRIDTQATKQESKEMGQNDEVKIIEISKKIPRNTQSIAKKVQKNREDSVPNSFHNQEIKF